MTNFIATDKLMKKMARKQPGVTNVTVNLYDDGTNLVSSTATDTNGIYAFTNLVPDMYFIEVVPPSGFQITSQDQGGDDTLDSDIDTSSGRTAIFTLRAAETNLTIDGGLTQFGDLGDFVWDDLDGDGVQDAGEPGISNTTVRLLDASTNLITSILTDTNGLYLFTNLVAGTYFVEFATLAGYTFTPQDQGGDDTLDSDPDPVTGRTVAIVLPAGQVDRTVDAGFFIPASLGDFVWEDDDGDGIQDAGEPGINGVTVNLLTNGTVIAATSTDTNGIYAFTNLPPVDYVVEVIPPAGFSFSLQDQGADDSLDSDVNAGTGRSGTIALQSGDINTTIDAGLYQPARLGDYVWMDSDGDGIQDGGEPGFGSVTVHLLDAATNVISSTSTDTNGAYAFTNLAPAIYIVEFVAPGGTAFSPQDQGGDDSLDSDADPATGQIAPTALTSGEIDLSIDAGLFISATLGDFVWEDLDADGIQDVGEPGIQGVTVNLLTNGTQVGTTMTATNGLYLFPGLNAGDYVVEVITPAGFVFSPRDQGGDDTIDSDVETITGQSGTNTLVSGQTNLTVDVGLYRFASIGDFVFDDLDADGIQDAGETGIVGVAVNLFTNGTLVASTTTDTNGIYAFTNLPPADYVVGVVAPGGYMFSPRDQGGDDTVDSDVDTSTGLSGTNNLQSGENDLTIDAGLYQFAQIGDFVWSDDDGDGIQDAGEAGISNVTVRLLDSGTNQIDSTSTDTNGVYAFTNLIPGVYIVEFVAPVGLFISAQDQGGDDTLDGDADQGTGRTIPISLSSGENDLTWDAGLTILATIGDFAFEDFNANGIQDGEDSGITNVTVNLLTNGTQVASTTTDTNGFYLFANLVPGDYVIEMLTPSGLQITSQDQGGDDTLDSDIDPATGQTDTNTLQGGDINLTVDGGFYIPAGVGDFVFLDVDVDGFPDAGETGFADVSLDLLDSGTNVIETTLTDTNGLYAFTNLVPDTYFVTVTDTNNILAGFQITSGSSTEKVTLTSGQFFPDADFGYQPPPIFDFTKTVDVAGSVTNGQVLTYTITLTNTGDVQLTGVTITDPVPPGATYVTGSTNITAPTVPRNDETVRDDFDAIAYTNNDGTVDWLTDWVEFGDDGSPSSGDIRVNTAGRLRFRRIESNDAIERSVDLGGATNATLSFFFSIASLEEDISVMVSSNGAAFTTLDTFSGAGNGTTNYDISAFISTNTILRYENLGVNWDQGNDRFRTDNVQILFSFPPEDNPGIPGDPPLVATNYTLPTNGSLVVEFQVTVDTPTDVDVITNTACATSDQTIFTYCASVTNPLERAAIGDFVWNDLDADGIQDGGEPGISNVTVTLRNASSNAVAVTLTDTNGLYAFTNLSPNVYFVDFTLPSGFMFSPQDQGGDDTLDSDADTTTGQTAPTTLLAGENDVTVDAGMFPSGSIRGQVRLDTDIDGNLGDMDAGITNVTIQLFTDPNGDGDPSDGVLVDTMNTDTNGDYAFLNLGPTNYVVVETDPSRHVSTADTDPPNDNRIGVPLSIGEHSTGNDFLDAVCVLDSYVTDSYSIITNFYRRDPENTGKGTDVIYVGGLGHATNTPFDVAYYDDAGLFIFADTNAFSDTNFFLRSSNSNLNDNVDYGTWTAVSMVDGTVPETLLSDQLASLSTCTSDVFEVESWCTATFTDATGMPVTVYGSSNGSGVVYMELIDRDQNLNTNAIDTVVVTLTNAATGDSETVTLFEQGASTGVFANNASSNRLTFPISITGPPVLNNGTLSYEYGDSLNVNYTDPTDGLDVCGDIVTTHVLIVGMSARRTPRGVLVRWETASEMGTLGFFVQRRDGGRYKNVNDDLLPAMPPLPGGGVYHLLDRAAPDTGRLTYRLIEIEQDGGVNRYGPFIIEVQKDGVTAKEEVVELGEHVYRRSARARGAAARRLPAMKDEATAKSATIPEPSRSLLSISDETTQALKAEISTEGVYSVNAATISTLAGLDVSIVTQAIQNRRLRMSNAGRDIAWHPVDDHIVFYAVEYSSFYTDSNVYWIQRGEGTRFGLRPGQPPVSTATQISYAETRRFEDNTIAPTIIFQDAAEDIWMWDFIIPGNPSLGSKSFPFELDALASTETQAALSVHLAGGTQTPAGNDHHVVFTLNGNDIGEHQFDGRGSHTVELSFDHDSLIEGTNTLEITALLDAGIPFGLVYLNAFEVTYQRRYAAVDGKLHCRADGNSLITVEGFEDQAIRVLEVSDPSVPTVLLATRVEGAPGDYSVTFAPSGPAEEYFVTESNYGTPAGLRLRNLPPLDSADNAADHLIIAPDALVAGAQVLADYRSGQGVESVVVSLEDVYDVFNHGLPEPVALRRLLQRAYTTWQRAPAYAVLAGAGTYDFKDYLGHGGNLVPPLMASTPIGVLASDVQLGDVAGDAVPEIAVGRLPVLTADELAVAIDKIIMYESTAAENCTVSLVADNPDRSGNYPFDSRRIGEIVGAGVQHLDFDGNVSAFTDTLLDAFRGDCRVIGYVGHGGIAGFAHEEFLHISDLPGMDNADSTPVVAALSCLIGQFAIPGIDSHWVRRWWPM
jgi:uncharacterized repeat protein (TIGR01451 family)